MDCFHVLVADCVLDEKLFVDMANLRIGTVLEAAMGTAIVREAVGGLRLLGPPSLSRYDQE